VTDAEYYQSLPRKAVGAGGLFTDHRGHVLLVKPSYKEPWEIPGGSVEAGESPLAACVREVQEELGITCQPGRLLAVDYRLPGEGGRGDALRFVFAGGVLTDADTPKFVLDPAELLEWRFVDPADLDSYVIAAMAGRLRACLADDELVYLEEGRPPQ
jgi:8-oxo-dGTP diphosphatase